MTLGVLVIGGVSVMRSDDSVRTRPSDSPPAGDNTSAGAVPAVQSIRARFDFDRYHLYSPDGAGSDRTIEDEANGSLVVTGMVSEIRPGVGMSWNVPLTDGEAEVKTILVADDPEAMLITGHVDIVIDELAGIDPAGSSPRPGDTVTIALHLSPGDIPSLREYLEGDEVLAIVYSGSQLFDYAPNLYAVAGDGGYLARVNTDGRLEFFGIAKPIRRETGTAALTVQDVLDMAG